jgi:hypothetical protein
LVKFVSIAAFAVCAIAAPAMAADLHVANSTASIVRITLANKAPTQLTREIQAAAELVCADGNASMNCVQDTIADANRQVHELTKGRPGFTKIEVARNDPTSISISLAGKSAAQVKQEIDVAATNVCRNEVGTDFRECVAGAVADAEHRLSEIRRAGGKLASN